MPKGKYVKVIGKKINHLTILQEIRKNGKLYCKCKCDCGTEKIILKSSIMEGKTKTCGCGCNKNLVGLKQGKLTVIAETEYRTKKGRKIYLCKCDCGNEKLIGADVIHSGVKSCGCLNRQAKYDNLIGNKFGKLTVIKELEKTKYGQRQYLCKCDCGNEKVILGTNLIHEESTSCGCNKGYVENTKINLLKREEAYPNSKSGIKGVWQDKSGYWHAMITVCSKRIFFYGGIDETGKNKCIEWRKMMVEKYHKPLIEKHSNL